MLSSIVRRSASRTLGGRLLPRAQKPEYGATAVEYGLMVAFIAIAIIGSVLLFGTKVSALFIIPAGVL